MQIPVVPIYIDGMFQVYSRDDSWPKTGPVRIAIGKPLRFDRNTRIEDATEEVRTAIETMAKEAIPIQIQAGQLNDSVKGE